MFNIFSIEYKFTSKFQLLVTTGIDPIGEEVKVGLEIEMWSLAMRQFLRCLAFGSSHNLSSSTSVSCTMGCLTGLLFYYVLGTFFVRSQGAEDTELEWMPKVEFKDLMKGKQIHKSLWIWEKSEIWEMFNTDWRNNFNRTLKKEYFWKILLQGLRLAMQLKTVPGSMCKNSVGYNESNPWKALTV